MNHLLLIPLGATVPESFIASLRGSGWKMSVASNIHHAEQLLRSGVNVEAVILGSDAAGDGAEAFVALRSIYRFHPQAMVVMFKTSLMTSDGTGRELIKALNFMEDARQDRVTFAAWHRLSPAQRRIAELVAQAYPNREIARVLKIKEQSVRNELSRIFKKASVRSRVELALLMRTVRREPSTTVTETPWRPDLAPAEGFLQSAGTASSGQHR